MTNKAFSLGLIIGVFYVALVTGLLVPSHAQEPPKGFPRTALGLVATKTVINGSGASIMAIVCDNPSNAEAFLQLFNATSANVTVGTTVPTLSLGIQSISTPLVIGFESGWWFNTAITAAATTTATGSSAPNVGINCNFALR
jgi:hypothetical protein